MTNNSRRKIYADGLRHKTSKCTSLDEFNWHGKSSSEKTQEPEQLIVAGLNESQAKRSSKFINRLYTTCMTCCMCDIGTECVENDGLLRDPHLLSNRNISNYMIIIDRPTWKDISYRDNNNVMGELEAALEAVGIRSKLYITYLVKCCSEKDNPLYYDNCSAYFKMELRALKPKLLITVGRRPFEALRHDNRQQYEHNFSKIILSKYDIKMLPLAEMQDPLFGKHLTILGQLITRVESNLNK